MVLGFVVDNERALLIKKRRGLGRGLYNGFGGKVKERENYESALKREVREEIGIEVKKALLKAVLHFTDSKIFIECPVFLVNEFEGEIKESEEAIPVWFKKDELPFEQMWPDDKYWLPLVLEWNFIYGKFHFDDLFGESPKLLKHEVKTLNEKELEKMLLLGEIR